MVANNDWRVVHGHICYADARVYEELPTTTRGFVQTAQRCCHHRQEDSRRTTCCQCGIGSLVKRRAFRLY